MSSVACCMSSVACCMFHVACRALCAACCVLCVACCVLHVPCRVLRVPCCMLCVVCCVCCVLSCRRRLTEPSRFSARTVLSTHGSCNTQRLAQSWRRCGRGERSPGADAAGAIGSVPAQMWENERVLAQMWLCRCGRPAPPNMLRDCRRRMHSASSSRITAQRTWRSSSHSARSPSLRASSIAVQSRRSPQTPRQCCVPLTDARHVRRVRPRRRVCMACAALRLAQLAVQSCLCGR